MKQLKKCIRIMAALYSPGHLASLVWILQSTEYGVTRYVGKYWTTQDFVAVASHRPTMTARNRALLLFVTLGSLLQSVLGLSMLIYSLRYDAPEAMLFGLALLLSYPVVWAHLLALLYTSYKAVWSLLHPKLVGRALVCSVLESQVTKLRTKHHFTVIAVAGSVGKTSTKLAIAHTLEPSRRVIYQTGNYNDRVTVPLVLFGQKLPNLFNIVAWAKIFLANERAIKRPNFYDIAVVELGTDHPGDIQQFAYLQPDITVITAITPEHMEHFGTLDAVAAEELTVCDYSKQVVVNVDDTPLHYLKGKDVLTFSANKNPDFSASGYKPDGLQGSQVTLRLRDGVSCQPRVTILGEQGVKIVLAAAVAAQLAGLSADEISRGLDEVKPFAGRMQILRGAQESMIIDDTYNASPVAVKAGLDVLYAVQTPRRIAILGSMNELGDYSQEAHVEVGKYCNPQKLDLVVTIGADARTYLAPAARDKGCTVEAFDSPYDAGVFVRKHLVTGAVVLGEGSQNRVFAEEALKSLLADPSDSKKLVRQSSYWMTIKAKQFRPVDHETAEPKPLQSAV